MENKNLQLATFGGGCFWCVEAIFQEIEGVEKVVSGYSGDTLVGKPTYKEVNSGLTGHAEVVQVTFDADIISYEKTLVIFMTTHDPTTLNKQGADNGTQYRSVIYYHNECQRRVVEIVLKEIVLFFENPIVTEVSPLIMFFEAEKEHQNYYKNNQTQSYCSFVIAPKLANLRKIHTEKLITN